MSQSTPQLAQLAGRAVVRLKDGSVYEGYASYDGKQVTISGRLRVVSMVGGLEVVSYRPARRRTEQWSRVDHIVWEDE